VIAERFIGIFNQSQEKIVALGQKSKNRASATTPRMNSIISEYGQLGAKGCPDFRAMNTTTMKKYDHYTNDL
jgi:hypothetical protein